jgi:hypothetical protein
VGLPDRRARLPDLERQGFEFRIGEILEVLERPVALNHPATIYSNAL